MKRLKFHTISFILLNGLMTYGQSGYSIMPEAFDEVYANGD